MKKTKDDKNSNYRAKPMAISQQSPVHRRASGNLETRVKIGSLLPKLIRSMISFERLWSSTGFSLDGISPLTV